MIIPLACAAILAASTLAQGLDPAQIVLTSDTTSPEPIGDQAAIDGDSAIILGGPITGTAPLAPLRVLFMEHQPNGVWVEVQAIDLPQGTLPLGDGTVAIQGDIATVFVHAQVSPSFFRTYVHVFERDQQGVWSLTQSLDGATSGSELGVPNMVDISGEDLLIQEIITRGLLVYRRSAGPGTWTRVQTIGLPLNGWYMNEIAVDGDLAVVSDQRLDALVFQRDAAGTWSAGGVIPAPSSPEQFGPAYATDGERIAFLRLDQNQTFQAIEIYWRPDPSQPSVWALEASIVPQFFIEFGHQIWPAPATGQVQRFSFENDTLVFRSRDGCGQPGAGRFVLTVRRNASSGGWFVDDPICTTPLTGTLGTRLLAFDGTTLLVGDRGAEGGGGAVAFAPILNATIDCDLDGTLDVLQIASCAACDLNGNGRIDVCESTGAPACVFNMINSSGRIATLQAFGDPLAMGGLVLLRSERTATSSFGMLISGDQMTSQPVANGNGWRCVGGPRIGRFTSQVGATGAIGAWDTLVDPSMIPTPAGVISLLPGTTWIFQGWFRDGSSVNFTNTVSVTFQ